MMAMAEIAIREKSSGRRILLWIPILALWVLLLPIGLVALPLLLIAALIVGVNPFRAIAALSEIVAALKGTHLEIEDDRRAVVVHVE
jgi:hypothetical protein